MSETTLPRIRRCITWIVSVGVRLFPAVLTILLAMAMPSISDASPVHNARTDGFSMFMCVGVVFVAWRALHYRKSPRSREYRFFRWLYMLFPIWAPIFYILLSGLIIRIGSKIVR
jgi:hypothetical protein